MKKEEDEEVRSEEEQENWKSQQKFEQTNKLICTKREHTQADQKKYQKMLNGEKP